MGKTIEWKIIGIEGKTIKIIPNAVSSDSLTIDGANGWNNFIDALDDVCGIVYGNATSEYYTATARSLTIEDINNITRYKPASPEIYYAENFAQGENYFPIAYLEERGVKNITEETSGCGYAANSSIKVENTYYSYETEKEKGFNTKFANWINLGNSYCLASTGVNSDGELAYFYIWFLNRNGYVDIFDLFGSDLNISRTSIPVRPVVSLTPIVAPTLEKTVEEGDIAINYWKFE